MIRPASGQDIPAIVEMVGALHRVTRQPIEAEPDAVRATLQRLILRPDGLLLVAEHDRLTGFIAASIGYGAISSAPIAHEHGWWSERGGDGLRLLILYERWAQEQGCQFIRMSTPPHNQRAAKILEKRGFFVSELAWAKAI